MSERKDAIPRRLALTGVVAALAFGALASVGAALSPSSPAAAAKQYPKGKITICHRTHSKKHPFVTIRVSARALKAHLRHGDSIGRCDPSKLGNKKNKKNKKHGHHGNKNSERGKGKPDKPGAGKPDKPGAGKPDKPGAGKPDKPGRGKHK